MRTTVTIDDRLLELAKERAHEQHLTLGQLVERGLQAELMRPTVDRGERPELPTLEIGENGEAKLDLWCKSGRGQFSVAGDTVIFMPGTIADNSCTPSLAQADDALIAKAPCKKRTRHTPGSFFWSGTQRIRYPRIRPTPPAGPAFPRRSPPPAAPWPMPSTH